MKEIIVESAYADEASTKHEYYVVRYGFIYHYFNRMLEKNGKTRR